LADPGPDRRFAGMDCTADHRSGWAQTDCTAETDLVVGLEAAPDILAVRDTGPADQDIVVAPDIAVGLADRDTGAAPDIAVGPADQDIVVAPDIAVALADQDIVAVLDTGADRDTEVVQDIVVAPETVAVRTGRVDPRTAEAAAGIVVAVRGMAAPAPRKKDPGVDLSDQDTVLAWADRDTGWVGPATVLDFEIGLGIGVAARPAAASQEDTPAGIAWDLAVAQVE
jgi:hypothetical protein